MSMRYAGQVPEGDVYEVTLENRRGFQAKILSLGATLRSLLVPDQEGILRDVVLGFDGAEAYTDSPAYFGATLGRVAGRIKDAAFEWNGVRYDLEANHGPHQLHGGPLGFSRRLWTPIVLSGQEALLRFTSPAGDMGFPGQVEAEVAYCLEGNALRIRYRATADAVTPLSLSHHSYFNLGGHGAGSIGEHRLQLSAAAYTPVDGELIPTGEVLPLEGSALDLRQPRRLGDMLTDPDLVATKGLDHNFVLAPGEGPAAVLSLAESGLSLELYTDRPCLHIYTAGYFGEIPGKEGTLYRAHQGIALEPQAYPDAVHHPAFPSCLVQPGELWTSETLFRFEGAGLAGGRRAQMLYI